MKNYAFAAIAIAATIITAGGLTLTAGVASACIIGLVTLLSYNKSKIERDFINTDKARVNIIEKKINRITELEKINNDLGLDNIELKSKLKTFDGREWFDAFNKTNDLINPEVKETPVAKKVTKRKTTKTK